MRPRLSFLALALVLAGCAPRRLPSAAPGQALTATSWTLVELGGYGVLAGPGGRVPGLQFTADEQRVAGYTGCNQLAGRYSLEGDQLGFPEPLVTTRMACLDPAIAQQEQRFLHALQQTHHFSVQGRQLILYDGDVALARFTAKD